MKKIASIWHINHVVCPLLALLAFLLAPVAGFAQPQPNELKQRILAQAQSASPNDYAFTRTIRNEMTSGDKTEKKITIEKFDPGKPVGEQWTLVSVDGAPPSPDAMNEFRKGLDKRRVPGYHRLAGYFATRATASADSSGRTVFRFMALPKDTVKVMDTDISQNTTADATASEENGIPFVQQVHFVVKPMRLKLIAKLERYESIARYRIGPAGKPLLVEQTSDMFGSGLGREGRAHTVITYSDYRAVGNPH